MWKTAIPVLGLWPRKWRRFAVGKRHHMHHRFSPWKWCCALAALCLCFGTGVALALADDELSAGSDETTMESGASAASRSTTGYWRTDRGPLTIFVIGRRGVGQASYHDGMDHIRLELASGDDLLGIWDEKNGALRCGDGRAWGGVVFRPDGKDRFVGLSSPCSASLENADHWDGVLIAGEAWFAPDIYIDSSVRRPELDMDDAQARALMYRAHADGFDPAAATSYSFDFTCDGGLDRVYLWPDPTDEADFFLSVAHRERMIFEGEDTNAIDTIILGESDPSGAKLCVLERTGDLEISELDNDQWSVIGGSHLAPTCSTIFVGPGDRCRIFWDLERGTFGIQ